MFSLNGKAAIVTGGASGIGAAIAQRLKKAGARVLVADISDSDDLVTSWDCEFIRADLSKPEEVTKTCEQAITLFGKLDILINLLLRYSYQLNFYKNSFSCGNLF